MFIFRIEGDFSQTFELRTKASTSYNDYKPFVIENYIILNRKECSDNTDYDLGDPASTIFL